MKGKRPYGERIGRAMCPLGAQVVCHAFEDWSAVAWMRSRGSGNDGAVQSSDVVLEFSGWTLGIVVCHGVPQMIEMIAVFHFCCCF